MIKIPLKNGDTIICGNGKTYEHGGYLSLIDNKGKEILYYDIQEWIDEPESVIGAFMNTCSMPKNSYKVTKHGTEWEVFKYGKFK